MQDVTIALVGATPCVMTFRGSSVIGPARSLFSTEAFAVPPGVVFIRDHQFDSLLVTGW